MIRRRPAVPATAFILLALSCVAVSSCATVDRNDVAAEVGPATLTPKAVETLAATGDAPTGDELRVQITKWIRTTALEESNGLPPAGPPSTSAEFDTRYADAVTTIAGDPLQSLYESGVNGSPVVCLAAITATSLEDANRVLTLLNNGTPFADAARQNSTDTVIAQAGGIVMGGPNGDQECLDPAGVNPAVMTALKDTPVGQPIVADLDTFSAVLMLRPYADLLPASQLLIAGTIVSQDQLDAIVDDADIYVDPRYGRWDPDSGSVVALIS